MRDFQPESPVRDIALFACLYVIPALFAGPFVKADLLPTDGVSPRHPVQAVFVVGLYLLGGAVLLLYAVFGARRFRFSDEGFAVFTWRGWCRFRWSQVERATITSYKGNPELVLFIGRVRRVSVPIASFRQAGSLLAALRGWLPVPISASPSLLARIQDR